MSNSRIVELANRIAANTAKVNSYLEANDLPQPSFDPDAPLQSLVPPTETDVAAARQAAINDCADLRDLLLGPKEHLTNFKHNELIGQNVILRFNMAEKFPVGEETTFAELAAASGLNEVHVRKVLRLAMAQHIFCEPRDGVVAHTAASRLLAEDKGLHNWLRFSTDDLWHAACATGSAMEKWQGSEEPHETGFSLANRTDKSMFGFLSENPDRLQRFAAAMRFFTERPGLEPVHVVDGYDWGSIGDSGTVVDVGGSHGVIATELARRFYNLKRLVVQDLDEPVIREAELQRPTELADRVEYQVHDFFTEQPVHGAEVYFLRAILHNWSDKYALKILRSLVPALKVGAKVVLNDQVLPTGTDRDLPAEQAAGSRANDLTMLELFNAGDREMGEWEALFAKAHSGFRFLGGRQPPGSRMWILVAEWVGDSS